MTAGFYMLEQFGAWQVGDDHDQGAVRFKLFFPDRSRSPTQYEARAGKPTYGDPQISGIRVVGDFMSKLGLKDWDWANGLVMARTDHAKGTVWVYQTPVELPQGFYQYKYHVTFKDGSTRKVPDPCTRYGGTAGQNSGFVVGGSSPADNVVAPVAGGRKHLRDLVVYELNIDDFTEQYRGLESPAQAVRDRLDYLQKQLGINAIEFLPWTTWSSPGYSWGYNPVQDFAVEYRYVTKLDEPAEKLSVLKGLINDCHGRGIHVILDGVYNHVGGPYQGDDGVVFGFPYFWLYQNTDDCPYLGNFAGDFGPGLPDRDYHNGCTREFVRDVCYYWMDEFGIDGFRLDAALYYYSPGDSRGLPQLVADIRSHTSDTNFAITLEFLDITAAGATNQVGATSYWNNELYGRAFDYLWNWAIDQRIVGALNTHVGLDDDKVATTYLSNHDHSQVAWQAGARDNQGAMEWYRVQPYAIALMTSPGCPLVPNGQEFAEDYWVMEDDQGSGRRVTPRRLRWDFQGDKIGMALGGLFSKLIALRLAHPALRSNNFYPANWPQWQTQPDPQGYGVDVSKGVLIYHRWGDIASGAVEYFMIVLNFSQNDQVVDVPFPENGTWQEMLSGRPTTVDGFWARGLTVESNWGKVFYREP
jgi:1,4-alpha-glucan branching enzyme